MEGRAHRGASSRRSRSKEVTYEVIGFEIGLAAFLVTLAVIARGITRRYDLGLEIASAFIAIGQQFDELADRAWSRQVRGLSDTGRWYAKTNLATRVFDRIGYAFYKLGWRVEERVRGPRYTPYYGSPVGLGVASGVRSYFDDLDDLDYEDDEEFEDYRGN